MIDVKRDVQNECNRTICFDSLEKSPSRKGDWQKTKNSSTPNWSNCQTRLLGSGRKKKNRFPLFSYVAINMLFVLIATIIVRGKKRPGKIGKIGSIRPWRWGSVVLRHKYTNIYINMLYIYKKERYKRIRHIFLSFIIFYVSLGYV